MTNALYYGDNLEVLRNKIRDESIALCYIDPPFNSKRTYNQIYNNIGSEDRAQAQAFIDTWTYDDLAVAGYDEITLNAQGRFSPKLVDLIKGLRPVLGEGSLLAYLISIALRVTEIHRVLARTGSFYLHCDPTASHYLKLIVDAVFLGGATSRMRSSGNAPMRTTMASRGRNTSAALLIRSYSTPSRRGTPGTGYIEPMISAISTATIDVLMRADGAIASATCADPEVPRKAIPITR